MEFVSRRLFSKVLLVSSSYRTGHVLGGFFCCTAHREWLWKSMDWVINGWLSDNGLLGHMDR